jgi:hypothetical protein
MQYARQLALGSAELPSIWLAIVLESVNRDAKELATFRGVDESTPSLDIASPVAYSGSPYISSGNLERLSQAESRTRLAVQQQAQQLEAQDVLGREGRLSLGNLLMMRKLEWERREQEAGRAASHPLESKVPPEPPAAIQADPDKFGRATEARSLFGREHYSGAVMDNLVSKLTGWAKGLTRSDNWAFIPPDVLNGLMNGGDSNNRAHQRVRQWTSASTQFACFLCGNYSHWFLVVAELGSCTINIFHSAGAMGNQLAIKHLLPLLMYMGSLRGFNLWILVGVGSTLC